LALVGARGIFELRSTDTFFILYDVFHVCHRFCISLVLAAVTTAAQGGCSSISSIICGTGGFETLCTAVKAANLVNTLGGGTYTLFAPNNQAFSNLPNGTLPSLLNSTGTLRNILLFHAVNKKVRFSDLVCTATLKMANGKDSRTVCLNKGSNIYQKGAGNAREKMPEIISTDMSACNGLIHVVSQVMLPPL
jgi:uncharacterized surface protein with fasciclin (FAS1) repeats